VAEPTLSEVNGRAACIYYKVADTAATTPVIRDIRMIRGVWKFPNFRRKEFKNFTQYTTEQPEMTRLMGIKEGQNEKNLNRKKK